MKSLDRLTREDLLEEHDLMMGVYPEEQALFLLDTMTAEELMIAMEDHDQLSRFGLVEEAEEGPETSPSRQRENWQDHVIGPIVGRRGADGQDKRQLGSNQPPNG